MIDWTKIGRAETHPVRVAILDAFDRADGKLSPADLTNAGCGSLVTVSYHVKALFNRGILDGAGTRPGRGGLEHFYVVNKRYRV